MTPLREQMIDHMSSKDFSQNNIDSYTKNVAKLAIFYNKSPDKLSTDEVQKYLVYLESHKNLARPDFYLATSAIHFFYHIFLKSKTISINPLSPKYIRESITINPFHSKMMNELKFRRLADSTIESYVSSVTDLAKFYSNIPLYQISNDQVKEYLLYLQENRGLAWNTCNIVTSGLLFFYNNVLSDREIKLKFSPKKQKKSLPEVLSKSEIEALINSTSNMRDRVMLMTIYSAGLRVGEVVILQPTDIDSKRMTIRVLDSKGNKDRYTVLSNKLLKNLQYYYQSYRPVKYLFTSKDKSKHISISTVQKIYNNAKNKAKITKGKGIHTLRHSFATHLYESGIDIQIIQKLLGHASIHSTLIYTHVSRKIFKNVKSPLDISEKEEICD